MRKTEFTDHLERSDDLLSTIILSSLPILKMLSKLSARKEDSKSPFPSEFSYEDKTKSITETIERFESHLSGSEISRDAIISSLEEMRDIAGEVNSYIKTASLKGDYEWIHDELEDLASMIR